MEQLNQPESTPINPYQSVWIRINLYQPVLTGINRNQPEKSESTRINPNQPESTCINPYQPESIRINQNQLRRILLVLVISMIQAASPNQSDKTYTLYIDKQKVARVLNRFSKLDLKRHFETSPLISEIWANMRNQGRTVAMPGRIRWSQIWDSH